MAKQSGIHKLRGKLDGVSYYRTKYVNEDLARRINTCMSQRVKTAPEYENTRLYNREFGYCGATAANMLQAVLSRYKVILNPFSQGSLVKYLRKRLSNQTGHVPLGERFVAPNQEVIDSFNRVFKAPFEQYLAPVQVSVTEAQGEEEPLKYVISYNISAALLNTCEMSKLPNVEGVEFSYSAFHTTFGTFSEQSQEYETFPTRQVIVTDPSVVDFEFGSTSDVSDDIVINPTTWNVFNPGIHGQVVDGVIIYATPYQVIGNEKVYLVDKASAIMVAQDTQE